MIQNSNYYFTWTAKEWAYYRFPEETQQVLLRVVTHKRGVVYESMDVLIDENVQAFVTTIYTCTPARVYYICEHNLYMLLLLVNVFSKTPQKALPCSKQNAL